MKVYEVELTRLDFTFDRYEVKAASPELALNKILNSDENEFVIGDLEEKYIFSPPMLMHILGLKRPKDISSPIDVSHFCKSPYFDKIEQLAKDIQNTRSSEQYLWLDISFLYLQAIVYSAVGSIVLRKNGLEDFNISLYTEHPSFYPPVDWAGA